MRRWISALISALLLANLALWPTVALAQVLEHEREVLALDTGNPPAEPATHCRHGCAGHYGQHFQSQVGVVSIVPHLSIAEAVPSAANDNPPRYFPALPFRPPLTGAILS